MSLIEPVVSLPPAAREKGSLRRRAVRFGATIAAVVGAAGLFRLHRDASARTGFVLVAFAAAILVYSLVHPSGALAARTLWLRLGSLLGRINSVIVLTVAYVFVLTPLSFLVRVFGGRSFRRKTDESYFTTRSGPRDPTHFEHPY